jgi:hypothetical protein
MDNYNFKNDNKYNVHLNITGNDGGGGDMSLESRVSRIEHDIKDLKYILEKIDQKIEKINDRLWSNFLWIVGIIITLFVIGTGSTILTILLKHFN